MVYKSMDALLVFKYFKCNCMTFLGSCTPSGFKSGKPTLHIEEIEYLRCEVDLIAGY